jgi:hypothetical protein
VSATVMYPPPSVPSAVDATATATATANGLGTPRQFLWQVPAAHPYAMYKNDKVSAAW